MLKIITYNSAVAIEQNSLQNIHRAIALGNFDGVHLGHQEVIKPILKDNMAKKSCSCFGHIYPPSPRVF